MMSNLWDQFFGVQPRQNQVLPFPIWTEHYLSTVKKPSWLSNYNLVHITNQAEQLLIRAPIMQSSDGSSEEHNTVHALYRAFFTDLKDWHDLLLALEIGHTIAIVGNDETKPLFAIGAITFMYTKANDILLYLHVHNAFRRSGFGTCLLYLMGMTIPYRTCKDCAGIYWLANEKENMVSMSFYAQLGFEKLVDPNQVEKPIPRPVALIKNAFLSSIPFLPKRRMMVWFGYRLKTQEPFRISLMNPTIVVDKATGNAAVCDNVYCQFPNGLTYGEYHCIN